MTDSEKIELIREMLEDFWGCSANPDHEAACLLVAISTVVDFKRKDKENA
jgi:hypothetical protein